MINTNQHPLDDVLDIEPLPQPTAALPFGGGAAATSPVDLIDAEAPTATAVYDERDEAIDQQLEQIHNQALSLALDLKQKLEWAPPAAQSRLGEVSIQALGAALDAIRQKADIKKHKDKLSGIGPKSVHTTNNNLVVVGRNELLRRAHSNA